MKMGRFLVHVQHCRHYIVGSVGLAEPVKVVLAPFIQSARLIYLFHIGMGASQYDADGLYLVLAYLAPKPCRIETVLYGCRSVADTIGELDKFSIEMRPLSGRRSSAV